MLMQEFKAITYGYEKYGYDKYGYSPDGYDKYGAWGHWLVLHPQLTALLTVTQAPAAPQLDRHILVHRRL